MNWQGVSPEKGFFSFVICQGLAQDLFTYLISDEKLMSLALVTGDRHFSYNV